MKRTLILCAIAAGAALAFGHYVDPIAAASAVTLAQVAAVPGRPQREAMPYRRIREDFTDFQNVVAGRTATLEIPRYALTWLGAVLQLGGTTFTKALIDNVRLVLGTKTLWEVTGTELDEINTYKRGKAATANWLHLDFTQPGNKEMGGEFIGGYSMEQLPQGQRLVLEVDINASAVAPTLVAKGYWGPPQDNTLVTKFIKTRHPFSAAGRQKLPLELAPARVLRMYQRYAAGADICGTAALVAAGVGNTGTGAVGTVTVSAGAKVGVHQFICVEPASNAGTFIHLDPDGVKVGKLTVAVAYSNAGLAFTVADDTDYVAGDSFTVTVPDNANGNVQRTEVRKDGRVMWDMECSDARRLETDYGRKPVSRMYVVDFIADQHTDGLLVTEGARLLEVHSTLGAADTITQIAEVLDEPQHN